MVEPRAECSRHSIQDELWSRSRMIAWLKLPRNRFCFCFYFCSCFCESPWNAKYSKAEKRGATAYILREPQDNWLSSHGWLFTSIPRLYHAPTWTWIFSLRFQVLKHAYRYSLQERRSLLASSVTQTISQLLHSCSHNFVENSNVEVVRDIWRLMLVCRFIYGSYWQ